MCSFFFHLFVGQYRNDTSLHFSLGNKRFLFNFTFSFSSDISVKLFQNYQTILKDYQIRREKTYFSQTETTTRFQRGPDKINIKTESH